MHRPLPIALLLAVFVGAAFAQSPTEISAGHLRLSLSPGNGLKLYDRGVPVITESSLYLVNQGWTEVYFNQDKLPTTFATSAEGGAQVATATYENADGYARYRYEVRPDDTFRLTASYGTKHGLAAKAEFHTLLNGNLLQGARYTAETVEGTRRGVVPMRGIPGTEDHRRLTPDVRRITFQTRLGEVDIDVQSSAESTSALTLMDSRASSLGWAAKSPVFWLGAGLPTKTVPPDGATITLTFHFGTPVESTITPGAAGAVKVATVKAATVPGGMEFPVIPRPKEATYGGKPVRLSPASRILVAKNATREERGASREIQEELRQWWGLRVKVATGKPSGSDIVLGRSSAAPAHAEGYALSAGVGGVRVAGHDARGVYNGAQTLKQLIRRDEKGVYVKAATIRDWPSLSFRGVQWYGGPKSWPFHKKMLERIIGPLKMNTMVFEVEYTQWNSQPKIWRADRSTTKADVKQTVDFARSRFIEPIPLVNSLGHSEWLFANKQNMDIVADPAHPYAYDPTNPKAYDVLFPIYQEAIDLFHPKTFHIGHDEVTMTGTFPPKGVNRSATDLIVEDTKKIHDWLAAKGIKTMMWGDMLLYGSEAGSAGFAPTLEDAKARRDALPKDITIADWHYHNDYPTFPSLAVLQKAGFPVIGTTWADQPTIRGFSGVIAQRGERGLLQSTWAGYAMSPEIVKGPEFQQFVAYLVAAEYAWNGGTIPLEDLGYQPDQAFLHFWDRVPASSRPIPGFTVDLADASNAAMWGWGKQPGASAPVATGKPFPTGRATLTGIAFETGHPVWLAGALNPAGTWPQALTVPLKGRKAASLEFLWNTTNPTFTDTPIARVRVQYEDGASVETPILYGRQIFAFRDRTVSLQAPIAWQGTSPSGEASAVRRWSWTNPRPDAPLRAVQVVSDGSEVAPVLLGLTGLAKNAS